MQSVYSEAASSIVFHSNVFRSHSRSEDLNPRAGNNPNAGQLYVAIRVDPYMPRGA